MGVAELLTIVFIVLKLTGVIAWSWWLVLLPTLIAVGLYVLWFVVILSIGFITGFVRAFKEWK